MAKIPKPKMGQVRESDKAPSKFVKKGAKKPFFGSLTVISIFALTEETDPYVLKTTADDDFFLT